MFQSQLTNFYLQANINMMKKSPQNRNFFSSFQNKLKMQENLF